MSTALASSQLLQTRRIPIKKIRVPTIRIRIRILPNRLKRPAPRNRTRGASVPCQHQGRERVERSRIPCTSRPPVIRAVDQRIPSSGTVIGIHEARDPRDHGRLAETIACGARRVVLDVEHAGERDAVAGPTAAVCEEEVSLRRAGAGVGVSKVVAAADEAGAGCAAVVRGEGRVLIGCSFRGLFAMV